MARSKIITVGEVPAVAGLETVVLWAIVWLLLINLATYLVFAYDKRAAEQGGWRISENTLLMMALLGGSPGALIARHQLRHKTRKQPFSTTLYLVVGLHLVLVAALAVTVLNGSLQQAFATALG
jgi:uncharacterized membrane protein YsdA (DUF1294 family)